MLPGDEMNARHLTTTLLIGLLLMFWPAPRTHAAATDAHLTIDPERVQVMHDTNVIVTIHTEDHHPELGDPDQVSPISVLITVPENTLVPLSELSFSKDVEDGGTLARRVVFHVPPTIGREPVPVLVQAWNGPAVGEPFWSEAIQVRIDPAGPVFMPLMLR
jgi:hypothetical protein